MKFCTFSAEGRIRLGCELAPGSLVDLIEAGTRLDQQGRLPSASRRFLDSRDLRDWFSRGLDSIPAAETICQAILEDPLPSGSGVYLLTQVRMLAPIARPGKIMAIGLNYLGHAREQNKELPRRPMMFAKFPTAVIGPDEPIKIPPITQQVDPEAELCVVILERVRRADLATARRVSAYMVGNDVSARDLQYSDKQWVRGKSLDTFAPCGPYVVTGDQVGDPHSLAIELRKNGEIQQSSTTSELIFNCDELVQYISEAITLEPGDVIFTGTPSGVGVYRNPPVFLEPGDVVEVTIEKLGTLRNPVVAWS